MRPIKFRAYYADSPIIKMFYWKPGEPDFNLAKELQNPKAVVMQFTGPLDKNGQEIYEGDVVVDEDNAKAEVYRRTVVSFDCTTS